MFFLVHTLTKCMGKIVKSDQPVFFEDDVSIRGALTVDDFRPELHTSFGDIPLPELASKPLALLPIRDLAGVVIGYVPVFQFKDLDDPELNIA